MNINDEKEIMRDRIAQLESRVAFLESYVAMLRGQQSFVQLPAPLPDLSPFRPPYEINCGIVCQR